MAACTALAISTGEAPSDAAVKAAAAAADSTSASGMRTSMKVMLFTHSAESNPTIQRKGMSTW